LRVATSRGPFAVGVRLLERGKTERVATGTTMEISAEARWPTAEETSRSASGRVETERPQEALRPPRKNEASALDPSHLRPFSCSTVTPTAPKPRTGPGGEDPPRESVLRPESVWGLSAPRIGEELHTDSGRNTD